MPDSIFIYDSTDLDESFERLKQAIDIIKGSVNNEIDKLKSQLEIKPIQQFEPLFLENIQLVLTKDNFTKIRYFELYLTDNCYFWLCQHKTDISSFLKKRTYFNLNEKEIQKLLSVIEAIIEHDKLIHEENILKNKSNQQTLNALYNLFDRIGIKTKYYDYSKKKKTTEMITYDWVKELKKQIPVYNEKLLEDLVKKYKDMIQRWYNEEIQRIEEEQKRIEEERKKKVQERELVLLLTKYNLELDADWEDLLEVILSKNKYLKLAYFLEQNRLDWSNGCEYALKGLHNFTIENEIDQKIYDDIYQYVRNWEDYCDGRVFRDCEFNYNVLYNMAKEQDLELYNDCIKIINKLRENWF